MFTASDRSVIDFSLSVGESHDSPEGLALISRIKRQNERTYILMDRAYEGDKMRVAAIKKDSFLVVPPKKNRENTTKYFINSEIKSNAIFCD